jgi:hypothetical protein
MAIYRLTLILLDGRYAVAKLDRSAPIPPWAMTSGHKFFSITRTVDELSIVCPESMVPENCVAERDWCCFRVAGQIAFTAVGVLASLTEPLANAGIGLFAISTFDTDYLFVKRIDMDRAIESLRGYGHSID